MDFEELLHAARKNELSKKEPVKCLQTKFKPPTKEQQKKDKMLSEGVLKFLQRKEEEEKLKKADAERRKEELLALRARDPKANKRIQTMLKRTKSANKSVMEDAIDNNNTADTLAGPSQPDEDDYGFVSETSSAMYNKLIQKMYSTPSDDVPKFAPSKKPNSANLSNTKERVKMALIKQEEEERLPHKRKRKHKSKEGDGDDDTELCFDAPDRDLSSGDKRDRDKEREKEKKARKQMPPPMDFYQLLKIAEQKQHEPVVVEQKVVKKKEPDVLMTKKQKMDYEKQQEWRKQRELRLQALEKGLKPPETKEDNKAMKRIPKLNQSSSEQRPAQPKVASSSKQPSKSSEKVSQKPKSKSEVPNGSVRPQKRPESSDKGESSKKLKAIDDETSRLKKERDEALRILREKEALIRERDEAVRKLKEKEQLIRERDEAMRKLKMLEESEKASKGKPLKPPAKSVENVEKSKPNAVKKPVGKELVRPGARNTPSSAGSKDPPSKPGTVREFPPRDLIRKDQRPGVREFPPRDIQRTRQFPPNNLKRPPPPKKRRLIDSEEEYDSELDDFIVDDDVGAQEDVSKVISEIFKYDKNKYSRFDDERADQCMESNFAQISKEEFYSAKCGLLEDLQDIQKEKAMIAKKKKR